MICALHCEHGKSFLLCKISPWVLEAAAENTCLSALLFSIGPRKDLARGELIHGQRGYACPVVVITVTASVLQRAADSIETVTMREFQNKRGPLGDSP